MYFPHNSGIGIYMAVIVHITNFPWCDCHLCLIFGTSFHYHKMLQNQIADIWLKLNNFVLRSNSKILFILTLFLLKE